MRRKQQQDGYQRHLPGAEKGQAVMTIGNDNGEGASYGPQQIQYKDQQPALHDETLRIAVDLAALAVDQESEGEQKDEQDAHGYPQAGMPMM